MKQLCEKDLRWGHNLDDYDNKADNDSGAQGSGMWGHGLCQQTEHRADLQIVGATFIFVSYRRETHFLHTQNHILLKCNFE